MRFIYDPHHWIDQIDLREGGYYQKCSSCAWLGRSLTDLDKCPACGEGLEEDAALVFGGLTVCCIHQHFHFFNDRDREHLSFSIVVEPADAPEVQAFMAKRCR